ncbi:MAG: DUF4416 family protein [Spirochaetota bacterium]
MGTAEFTPEKLIVGVLSTRPGRHAELERELVARFGAVERTLGPFPFDFTDYYTPEMGSQIMRYFYVMEPLVSPERFAEIKLATNELEQQFCEAGKRKINLDPGLMGKDRFALATTKDRPHRIPLQQGIYGEVTLIYMSGDYHTFPWTYADFRTDEYRDILKEVRKAYLKQLRERP